MSFGKRLVAGATLTATLASGCAAGGEQGYVRPLRPEAAQSLPCEPHEVAAIGGFVIHMDGVQAGQPVNPMHRKVSIGLTAGVFAQLEGQGDDPTLSIKLSVAAEKIDT